MRNPITSDEFQVIRKDINLKVHLGLFLCFFAFSSYECKSNSIEKIITFGDSLLINGNYSAALLEYQRAFFFAGNEIKCQTGKKTAHCFFMLGDYKMSRHFYDSAIYYAQVDSLKTEFEIQKAICYMMEEDFGYALILLNNLEAGPDVNIQRRKNLYQGICYFGIGQYDESYKFILNSVPVSDTMKIMQLREMYENQKMFKRPNANLAMIFSMVLPGMGQIYSGDLKNGLNSFVLLGSLSYIGMVGPPANLLVIVPLFVRYYLGGIVNVKQIAEEKQKEKRYYYYLNLTEVLLK
jgi:tetratricopeptide (TPR) repeat protein